MGFESDRVSEPHFRDGLPSPRQARVRFTNGPTSARAEDQGGVYVSGADKDTSDEPEIAQPLEKA